MAAILVEPIGHTGGVIDPPEEYLPILREICDRHNILLIFDEIITGIGRTGRMFAAETFGVTPDVLCVAKGLSRRLCAALGDDLPATDRRRLLGADRREPGLRRGAHVRGQPDLLRRRDRRAPRDPRARPAAATPGRRARGSAQRFEELARKYPMIGDIRGKGLFQAIEFVRDRATKARFPDATGLGRPGRPPGARARPALPVRPALDRLRPAADRHRRADRRDGRDPRPQPGRGPRRAGIDGAGAVRAEQVDAMTPIDPPRPDTRAALDLPPVRAVPALGIPLAAGRLHDAGARRGLDPPPVLRPRRAAVRPGLPRRLLDDLPRVVARLSRRVVSCSRCSSCCRSSAWARSPTR